MQWLWRMSAELQPSEPPEIDVSRLRLEDLERWAQQGVDGKALPLRDWLALAEAWRIVQTLRAHRGNRSATARALGIGRRTLYTKMDKLGLAPSWTLSGPGY